jgi:hypothetical protein
MANPVSPASPRSAGLGVALIAALRFVDWLMTAITWLLYAVGALSVLRAIAVVSLPGGISGCGPSRGDCRSPALPV